MTHFTDKCLRPYTVRPGVVGQCWLERDHPQPCAEVKATRTAPDQTEEKTDG